MTERGVPVHGDEPFPTAGRLRPCGGYSKSSLAQGATPTLVYKSS